MCFEPPVLASRFAGLRSRRRGREGFKYVFLIGPPVKYASLLIGLKLRLVGLKRETGHRVCGIFDRRTIRENHQCSRLKAGFEERFWLSWLILIFSADLRLNGLKRDAEFTVVYGNHHWSCRRPGQYFPSLLRWSGYFWGLLWSGLRPSSQYVYPDVQSKILSFLKREQR